MTNTGFAIVEPAWLDPFISRPEHRVFATALVSWLASELASRLAKSMPELRFKAVPVEYAGRYVALGVQSTQQDAGTSTAEEILATVEYEAARIWEEGTVGDFLAFVFNTKDNWADTSNDLFS